MNLNFLAQTATTSPTASQPVSNAAEKAETHEVVESSSLHIRWEHWLKPPSLTMAGSAAGILLLTLLVGWLLGRTFRKLLEKYQLIRSLRWGTFALAIYFALIALHPGRMVDTNDILSLILHKAFAAIFCLIVLRVFDHIVVIPLLTRGGKVPLSRFVHQIVMVVLAIFVILGYASWAFHIDLTSVLAGSAVISIVLGLALQETLGNFFSGMVMQASSPFQLGDWIQVGDANGPTGRVTDMTWRAVTLITGEGNAVQIPNGVVAKQQIVNFHLPARSTVSTIKIGLDHNLAPHDAQRVLLQAVSDTPGTLQTPAPSVSLVDYADSAIIYAVAFWVADPSQKGGVENEVRRNAWYRIRQAGYTIPFPIRTVELVRVRSRHAEGQVPAETERMEAIRKSPFFAKLSEEPLTRLARDARELTLHAGQNVYRQNDHGDSFFILTGGSVEIFAQTAQGTDVSVGIINAPSHFGELSALTGEPRPTTIRAKSDIVAVEITRGHLHDVFAAAPALMQHMSELVTQRQKERDAQLKKAGAERKADPPSAHQESVLEKMKSLFSRLHH